MSFYWKVRTSLRIIIHTANLREISNSPPANKVDDPSSWLLNLRINKSTILLTWCSKVNSMCWASSWNSFLESSSHNWAYSWYVWLSANQQLLLEWEVPTGCLKIWLILNLKTIPVSLRRHRPSVDSPRLKQKRSFRKKESPFFVVLPDNPLLL